MERIILTTLSGKTIDCEMVTRGLQYDVLHIYTHALTPVQAYSFFGDPEDIRTITVQKIYTVSVQNDEGKTVDTEVKEDPKVFNGYTEIFSVQKSQLVAGENEILVWLQRPREEG